MDITQIALAAVTEQFLAHVKMIKVVDPTSLADYLSIAAKLLVIKSRSILPTLEVEKDDDDISMDLEQRLLLYKQFRETAKALKRFDNARRQSFARDVSFEEKITFYPDPEMDTVALHSAILRVLKTLEEINSIPRKTIKDAISIQEKIDALQKIISEQIETKLSAVLAAAKDKIEVIVTFLALLELIKQKVLTVEQEQIFSEIIIKKYKDA